MQGAKRKVTVGHAVRNATVALGGAGVEAPEIEARVLVEHVVDRSRVWTYQNQDAELDGEVSARLGQLVEARRRGEPLAYLVGEREFFGRTFQVDARVLIPRPATEDLLERALAFARARNRAGRPVARVADVGTGSGILAASLATEFPDAVVYGIDRSADALAVARVNCRRHCVEPRVRLVQADLLDAVVGPFDLIVANLPYVPSADVDLAQPEVRREPRLALDGGPDGLAILRRFLAQAPECVDARGGIFLEVGWDQGAPVAALARDRFPGWHVQLHPDLEGRDRVVAITPNGNDLTRQQVAS